MPKRKIPLHSRLKKRLDIAPYVNANSEYILKNYKAIRPRQQAVIDNFVKNKILKKVYRTDGLLKLMDSEKGYNKWYKLSNQDFVGGLVGKSFGDTASYVSSAFLDGFAPHMSEDNKEILNDTVGLAAGSVGLALGRVGVDALITNKNPVDPTGAAIGDITGGAIGGIGGALLGLIPGIGPAIAGVAAPVLGEVGARVGTQIGGHPEAFEQATEDYKKFNMPDFVEQTPLGMGLYGYSLLHRTFTGRGVFDPSPVNVEDLLKKEQQ